jgi:hypothetical protein
MRLLFKKGARLFLRLALIQFGFALILAGAGFVYMFRGFLEHTTYGFVLVFLGLILLSHILAGLARTYIIA